MSCPENAVPPLDQTCRELGAGGALLYAPGVPLSVVARATVLIFESFFPEKLHKATPLPD